MLGSILVLTVLFLTRKWRGWTLWDGVQESFGQQPRVSKHRIQAHGPYRTQGWGNDGRAESTELNCQRTALQVDGMWEGAAGCLLVLTLVPALQDSGPGNALTTPCHQVFSHQGLIFNLGSCISYILLHLLEKWSWPPCAPPTSQTKPKQ